MGRSGGHGGQQEPCGFLQIDGRKMGIGLRLNLLLIDRSS